MARDQAQSQTVGKLTEENTHEALPRGFPFNTLSQQQCCCCAGWGGSQFLEMLSIARGCYFSTAMHLFLSNVCNGRRDGDCTPESWETHRQV